MEQSYSPTCLVKFDENEISPGINSIMSAIMEHEFYRLFLQVLLTFAHPGLRVFCKLMVKFPLDHYRKIIILYIVYWYVM